jgi:hypothetical protein
MSENQEKALELIVNGTAPAITSNFETLKTAIAERLEQYKIEVTEGNLAQAKKDATELGKAATQLGKIGKDKAREFSAPIDQFKSQVMELVGMIEEGREFIRRQVKVFEDKTRAVCLSLMQSSIKGLYLTVGVREEFRSTGAAQLEPLVGISKLTPKGTLTKAANDSLMAIVQADRAKQDRTDGRLARLTADCLTAGLTAPLQRDHVEHILMADDELYAAGIARLIEVELGRQKATEQRAVEEAEKAAKAAADKAAREAAAQAIRDAAQIEPAKAQMPQTQPAPAPVAPLCSGPIIPHQVTLQVQVVFRIKTSRISENLIPDTHQWFHDQMRQLQSLPPYEIIVRKEA